MLLFPAGVVLGLGKTRLQGLSFLQEDLEAKVGRLEGLRVLKLELLYLVGIVSCYN
jgi:hypothetical protein